MDSSGSRLTALRANACFGMHPAHYRWYIAACATVHIGKWSSWSLLVIMTFTIVVNLKHINARIHIPEKARTDPRISLGPSPYT